MRATAHGISAASGKVGSIAVVVWVSEAAELPASPPVPSQHGTDCLVCLQYNYVSPLCPTMTATLTLSQHMS